VPIHDLAYQLLVRYVSTLRTALLIDRLLGTNSLCASLMSFCHVVRLHAYFLY